MKLILFDIDGTLINAFGAGSAALCRAFDALYGNHTQWLDFCLQGMTDLAIIRRIHLEKLERDPSEAEVQKIKEWYTHYLPITLKEASDYKLLPFVKETLEALSVRDDVLVGLATGNFEKTGFMKLAHGGIDHHFKTGGFAEDGEDRMILTKRGVEKGRAKMGREPDDIFVIGDTVHDVRCGKGAGATVIGVATGPIGVDELKAAGADHALKDMGGCLDVIFA